MNKIWAGALTLAAVTGVITSTHASGFEQESRQIEGYRLNFERADVRRVAEAIFGSMLGADFYVDPTVEGQVTLMTARPVSKERLVEMFEDALGPLDAVLVSRDGRYQVLPRARAASELVVSPGGAMPGYGREIVDIRLGRAREIGQLIIEMLGSDIDVSVDDTANRLMLTGTARQRAAAKDIIARFDVDTLAQMDFELVKLELVDPETVVTELSNIFRPPYDLVGTRVRVIPLPRLKSVLLIGQSRGDLLKVEEWVGRLDTGAAGKRRLHAYPVQNGRAADLAETLQKVLPSAATPSAMIAAPVIAPPVTANETEDAAVMAPPAMTYREPPATAGPKVVPNPETNSLLIYADGEELQFILDALHHLDQPVPQVLVEAVLAEVTLNDDLSYGLDFDALLGDFSLTNVGNTGGVPAPSFPGIAASYFGSDAQGVLSAIQAKTDVKVLSAPKLIVANNQSATLQVGDQVPVITSQVQGVSSPGAPIVNNVELKDTGVIMTVTPRVNENGAVTFDIVQEVSDVAQTTSSGINSPTIQQRRIATTVSTQSGRMIALGGLIRERKSITRSGVPILSQIPIIGGLFGRRGQAEGRTELIMLLTPTVIRSQEEIDQTVSALIDDLERAGPLLLEAR